MFLIVLGFLVWLFATGKFPDWAALAKAPAQVQSAGSAAPNGQPAGPVANSNGQTLPSYPAFNAPAVSGDWLQSGWNSLMQSFGIGQ